jgi:hypothetical protein
MSGLRVTVTVADLDAAVIATTNRPEGRCSTCLLAKAIEREVGARASVGLSHASYFGGPHLIVPDDACDLINLFDNEAYDVLRALLPVTFVMEAR